MKKNPGMVFPARGKLSKILLVVKLKIFLMLFSCLQLNAAVHAQGEVKAQSGNGKCIVGTGDLGNSEKDRFCIYVWIAGCSYGEKSDYLREG